MGNKGAQKKNNEKTAPVKLAPQVFDVAKMSTIELKALAYDELAKQQAAAKNLEIVNRELAKR